MNIFPQNPVLGQNFDYEGKTFTFIGEGWILRNKIIETDPVFQKWVNSLPTFGDIISHDADEFAPALTTDQNYVSDAELTVLQNTSGTNTGDETQDSIGELIEKTELETVTDDTKVAVSDSEFLKYVKGLTIYTYIKSKLDLVYQSLLTFSTDIEVDKASTTKVSAIKTFYDWAVGKFAALTGGNTFSGQQSFDGMINHKVGEYFYYTASKTADTVNDRREYTESGVKYFQRCTVANDAKGGGTWVTDMQINASGKVSIFNNNTSLGYTTTQSFEKSTGIGQDIDIKGNLSTFKIRTYNASVSKVLSGTLFYQLAGTFGFFNEASKPIYFSTGGRYFEGDFALLGNGSINHLSGYFFYSASTSDTDNINDRRTSNVAGVEIKEICTVANATKGGGTWVTISSTDTSGVATLPAIKLSSGGSYVNENGGTIYHITRWFTPTSALTIAANGLSATITSGQFTSGMTGAKLRLTGGVNEPIITYVSSNSITLSFAVDSAFFGQSVAIADWGVYSIEETVLSNGDKVFYTPQKATIATLFNYNIFNISNQLQFANAKFYGNTANYGNAYSHVWSSTTNPDYTKDLGLGRNASGILEVNNGTAGTFAGLKLATLYANKIIPNSDTTGVVIRNAADSADIFKIDTTTGRAFFIANGNVNNTTNNIFTVSGNDTTGNGNFLCVENNATTGQIIAGFMVKMSGSSYGIFSGAKSDIVGWNILKGLNFTVGQFGQGHAISFRTLQGNSIGTGPNMTIKDIGVGIFVNNPETTLDVNGTTTMRDWVYLNNGTHTGDAVGDFRYKVLSGVLTFQKCDALNAVRGSGNWVTVSTI